MNNPDDLLEQRLKKLQGIFNSRVLEQRKRDDEENMTDKQEKKEFAKEQVPEVKTAVESPKQEVFEKPEEKKPELRGKTVLVAFKEDGKKVGGVSLYSNGEILYEGNYKPSQAATLFWNHVKEKVPAFSSEKAEKIEAELDATKEERDQLLDLLSTNKEILESQMAFIQEQGEEKNKYSKQSEELKKEFEEYKEQKEKELKSLTELNADLNEKNTVMRNVLFGEVQEKLLEFVAIFKKPELTNILEE